MNKWIRKLFEKIKKPVLTIAAFFLGIFLLSKSVDGAFLLKESFDEKKLQEQRLSSDTGMQDLSYFNIDSDTIADKGAAYADRILTLFADDPVSAAKYLNQDFLSSRGYEVDMECYLREIQEFSAMIEDNGYELCYIDKYEGLSSGGTVFNFTLVKPMREERGEFQYEPFERVNSSMTIYFENEEPVSYLPFPEPALHSYASKYGIY